MGTPRRILDGAAHQLQARRRRGRDPAVNLAVEGDHAFFRSYDKAGKTKRIRNNPVVEVAPCSVRGKPRGPAVSARARMLEGDDDRHAAQVIGRKYPILQRGLIRLVHRLARYRTMHYELTLVGE
jgi:uncharacterized protein